MNWSLLPNGAAIKGGNIVPKNGPNPWPGFWSTGWDWTWVQLQADSAIALGCNTVRVIGSVTAVLDGTISRTDYLAHWGQLADYCATYGLYLYASGGDDVGAHTYAEVAAEVVALCAYLTAKPATVAFDLLQERITEWASVGTQGQDLVAAAKVVTSLPVTFSLGSGQGIGVLNNTNTTSIAAIHNLTWSVDFIDLHVYVDAPASGLDNVFRQAPGLRVIIGEFGANQSETTGARAQRYTAMKAALTYTAAQARAGGALAWALNDQSIATAAQKWGLFDSGGVERTDMTDVFRTFTTTIPTAPQPMTHATPVANIGRPQ